MEELKPCHEILSGCQDCKLVLTFDAADPPLQAPDVWFYSASTEHPAAYRSCDSQPPGKDNLALSGRALTSCGGTGSPCYTPR